MQTILKTIAAIGATGALLCMTGYDCPYVNFKSQTIALGVCVAIALVCGLIAYKNEQE